MIIECGSCGKVIKEVPPFGGPQDIWSDGILHDICDQCKGTKDIKDTKQNFIKEDTMPKVTANTDITPAELSRLANNVRQLARQQRYPNDESDLATCANLLDSITIEEPKPEQEKPKGKK